MTITRPDQFVDVEELRGRAAAAAGDLAAVAEALGSAEDAELLAGAAERLRSTTFGVMLLGRFNSGKSTLANALLSDAGGDVLPTGDDPTTPMMIQIEYADTRFFETTDTDGGTRRWTFDDFRQRFVLDSDDRVNDQNFGDVAACRIGVPAGLLAGGVVLYDTAGHGETPERDRLAQAALHGCEAAIVVHSLHSPYGHPEAAFEAMAREEHVQVFTVVNTFGKEVDERKKRSAWNKLVLPRTGREYQGQDLTDEDIFFVDALSAATDRSLLAALEASLAWLLTHQRQAQHLARHTYLALSRIDPLLDLIHDREEQIRARIAAIEADQERVDREFAEIARRRAAVLDAITDAEDDARAEVQARFHRVMADLRAELPGALRRVILPSWSTGLGARAKNLMYRDRLAAELATIAQERAVARLEIWAADTQRLIAERFQAAAGEMELSLRGLAQAYADAFERLGDWSPEPTRTSFNFLPQVGRAAAFGMAGVGIAAAIAPVVVIPLVAAAAVVAAFTVAMNMEMLVAAFFAAAWADVSERLDVYRVELLKATESAFDTLRGDATRLINELAAAEAVRAGEARRPLAKALGKQTRKLEVLDAYGDRIDLSECALREVAAAADA